MFLKQIGMPYNFRPRIKSKLGKPITARSVRTQTSFRGRSRHFAETSTSGKRKIYLNVWNAGALLNTAPPSLAR